MILDSLSPEPELLDAARRWAAERQPLARLRALRDGAAEAAARPQTAAEAAVRPQTAAEAALWPETAALGWHGGLVPEALGGLGGTLAQAATLAEAQGEGLFALPWLGHAVQAVTVLNACAPSAARDAALRAAVTERLAALAGRLGDALPAAARARTGPAGWRLDGVSAPVPGAGQARRWLVLAQAEGGEGDPALIFVVEPGAPGVDVDDGPGLDGRRVAVVRLDDVVPVAGPLAVGAAARAAWQAGVEAALLAGCAEACGLARLALRLTLQHLRTREQFGQPLARFQALQHRAAEMAVACAYANAHAWGALAQHEALPEAERGAAAAAARVEVLRNARHVVEQAVQLHGGLGVSDELAVSHAFKRVVALEAALGDRGAHLERVAAGLLGPQAAAG